MENRKRNEPRKNGARFEVPLLVPSDNLMISHRIFRSEFETDDYLLDAFELFNETDEAVEYPVLPLVSINLWILMPESGPKVYLSGPLTFMHMVVVPKQTVLYCLRLRPETSRQILQMQIGELVNTSFELNGMMPLLTDAFLRRLVYCESFHERNLLFRRLFGSYPLRLTRQEGRVRNDIEYMEWVFDQKSEVRVSELAAKDGCTERYINQQFSDVIGVSPKRCSDILRMQYTLRILWEENPRALSDLAEKCGFYDQNHLNRLFQKLLGYTAGYMRLTNLSRLNLGMIRRIL